MGCIYCMFVCWGGGVDGDGDGDGGVFGLCVFWKSLEYYSHHTACPIAKTLIAKSHGQP